MKTRQRKSTVFFTIILMLSMVLSMMVPCFATTVSPTNDSHEENGGTNDVGSTGYTGDDSTYNDGKFSGGNGSEKHPYEITTASELVEIASDSSFWDKSFVLMNDIDLSSVCGENIDGENKISWTPIGNETNQFAGIFDGNGHKITGLYIRAGYKYRGLFGYVGKCGTIKNLGVEGSYSYYAGVSYSGTSYIGSLAGYNMGTVQNCYNDGIVNLMPLHSSHYLGGIVGVNASSGTVQNCYNSGNVKGAEVSYRSIVSGGIAADNYGTVQNCYNSGAVDGFNSNKTGGIVGFNIGTVQNCYNSNTVTMEGGESIGGIAGVNSGGIIENCYNNGPVNGVVDCPSGTVSATPTAKYFGGVVGKNENGGTVQSCYNSNTVVGMIDGYSTMFGFVFEIGGIVGFNLDTVQNCHNSGTVNGNSSVSSHGKSAVKAGGVIGDNGGTTQNCYNSGSVIAKTYYNRNCYTGEVVANNTGVVQNCYYLEGTNKQAIGHGTTSGDKISNVESKSTAQFTSGEVAWILQNVQADPTVQIWGQALSKDVCDKYPVLTSDPAKNVRKVTFIDNGVELAVKYYNTNGPLIVPEGPTLILPSKWEMNEPDSITLEFNGGSLVTVPAGTIVLPTNSPEITLSDGGIVDKDGNIMFPQGGNVEVDGTTYTIPAGGIVKPNGSGTVSLFSSADLDKAFKITSAYLVLSQDINVNYRTTLPDNYTDPRMLFLFNGVKTVVTDYTVDELGRYCFSFTGVNPQKMGDNICATLYATVDGKEVFTCVPNYSVRQYCINQLNKDPDDILKRMVSDLLMYGEKTQLYQNYKIDALVTDGMQLTPSNYADLDVSYNKQMLFGVSDPSVRYSSATLSLSNDMAVLFGITTEDPTPYTFEITINGQTTIYTAEDLICRDGKYYIAFRGIKATAFNDSIIAVIKKDSVQVSQMLMYSVSSYIQKNQNTEDQRLADLLQAIYNYGESAKFYTLSEK